MKLQLIRNATLRLTYARQQILIDPYLAEKHSLPSYSGRSQNPLVELPMSPEMVIAGAELVLISHLHTDHFDATAQALLPKTVSLFCQPGDEDKIKDNGFQHVTPIDSSIRWQGLTLTRTEGQHGTGDVIQKMGMVSGFVLQADNEPTIYWAGDTIWYEAVEQVINQFQPDIIITHSCGALWDDTLILMDAAQTIAVCQAAPHSTVIATHMGAVDHATVSRQQLRAQAEAAGISTNRLRIPEDGEVVRF